jgi:hypothetical protein
MFGVMLDAFRDALHTQEAWRMGKMPIYLVREYNAGVAAANWQEIRARSEADAAQIICGSKSRTEGRREELRADVRRMGDPSQATPILLSFYRDITAE